MTSTASDDRAAVVRSHLQRVAAGEPGAPAGLFDAVGAAVYAVARVVTGRTATAHAVTVEAFGEIASTADELRAAPQPLSRILAITQRLACDHRRLAVVPTA